MLLLNVYVTIIKCESDRKVDCCLVSPQGPHMVVRGVHTVYLVLMDKRNYTSLFLPTPFSSQ